MAYRQGSQRWTMMVALIGAGALTLGTGCEDGSGAANGGAGDAQAGSVDPATVGVGEDLSGVDPTLDTDADGTTDVEEGSGDSDADGVPAHLDPDELGDSGAADDAAVVTQPPATDAGSGQTGDAASLTDPKDACGGCAKGEYCATASCGADVGRCAPTGSGICTREYAPQCGCDGVTYGNTCGAAAAGVSIDYAGECRDDGGDGDAGTGDEPCTSCAGPAPGAPNGQCDDGTTFGPVCERTARGVCAWNIRQCGEFCGGIVGTGCEGANDFCDLALGTGCVGDQGGPISDASGMCASKGGGACLAIYDPVCGCDGVTYSSECNAHAAGASVARTGECK